MNPDLVDYDTLFKKKTLPEKVEIITKPKIKIQQIDNTKLFFNFVGILLLILGLYLLFQRQKDKEKNKRLYNQRVVHFFHDVNSVD
tara:strand:+ start:310 stop:567 length:258 start_codon:yes stop_codon:yes gene_type:complete